ncbi:MAG: hypothetical protein OEY77_00075 [Nitrospira sp.]|nr:hypothetical protein [Nitrospira sp.]
MQVKDRATYDGWVTKNTGPCGSRVIRFAQAWADLMEARLAHGATVDECADETSHTADTDGITGFMYGCAVSVLARCWVHGDALRLWHNKETQIADEGDRANESGGVA